MCVRKEKRRKIKLRNEILLNLDCSNQATIEVRTRSRDQTADCRIIMERRSKRSPGSASESSSFADDRRVSPWGVREPICPW
jgi:hypothetical protein